MATFLVTSSNYNDASFWNSISVSGGGHTLDFSALPSSFNVSFAPDTEVIWIWDGASWSYITEAGMGGTFTLGAPTQVSGFDTVIGGDGNFVVLGDANPELIESGAGFDSLNSGDGNDTVFAGGGGDIVDGGDGNDIIHGEDGNDSLLGGGGNDTLSGGTGNDTVNGGDNNDTVVGGEGQDTLIGGAGNDSIMGDGQWLDPADYASSGGSGACNLTVTNSADGPIELWWIDQTSTLVLYATLQPGETKVQATFENHNWVLRDEDGYYLRLIEVNGSQTIDYGATGLDDSINGGAGDDELHGQFGDDTINYGSGFDTVYGGSGNDRIDDAAGVNATSDAALVYGGAGDDTIYGSAGNDTTYGGDDDDEIWGEGGNDSLFGGTGNDFIDGGTGNDTIQGGTGNDTLNGGDGADSLSGGADADTFIIKNGFGNDTVIGGEDGTDNDTLDLSALTGPVTVSYSGAEAGTITDGSDTITFSQIENLILTDGADQIDAGTHDVTLHSGAGNDTIEVGQAQVDIDAGAGDDRVVRDEGTSSVDVGSVIDGGDGTDTYVVITPSMDGATVNLADEKLYWGTSADRGDLLNFENVELEGTATRVIGDDNANKITATGAHDNALSGGGGDDTILAGGGADTVSGDEGDDSLDGGDGADTIDGGAGNDTLEGGEGDDAITGGEGSDSISGGTGNDVITGGTGTADIISMEDFEDGPTGWTNLGDGSPVTENEALGGDPFMGRFAGNSDAWEQIQKTYDLTDDATHAVIEFDFLKIDTWDENFGEYFTVYIDGVAAFDFYPDGANSSVFGDGADASGSFVGGTWSVTSSGSDTNLGFGNGGLVALDRLYEVRIVLDTPGDTVTLGIGAKLNQPLSDESWGIDNVNVASTDDPTYEFPTAPDNDTIDGGAGDDFIDGESGDDSLTGGDGNDTFSYAPGDGLDTITDFNFGNSGTLLDGDSTNNDSIDLSGYYDHISELYADQADDGILNQSNALDSRGNATDYTDNTQFGSGSIEFQGASADKTSFTQENTGVVCFTHGTAIRTPRGDVLIEDLRVGDLVNTLDNGPQAIRWIGRRSVENAALRANEKLRPVLIPKGVMGAERNLFVSRQHALLLGRDHFARAIHLSKSTKGVRIAHGKRRVTYVHLMFDQHEVIFAENVPSESFYPGRTALEMFDPKMHRSFFQTFPDLRRACAGGLEASDVFGVPARAVLSRKEVMHVA